MYLTIIDYGNSSIFIKAIGEIAETAEIEDLVYEAYPDYSEDCCNYMVSKTLNITQEL